MPDESDTVIEDRFDPKHLVGEGSGADAELKLLEEIKALTRKTFVDAEKRDQVYTHLYAYMIDVYIDLYLYDIVCMFAYMINLYMYL
jgi:hypothetical protein